MFELYENPLKALEATNRFYESQEGFQYSEDTVVKWLKENVKIPSKGKVLDLCCGDGIWSKGFQLLNSKLDLYGIDISEGGIKKAMDLLRSDKKHFVVGDAEQNLTFNGIKFDLIFARGPGLYNQHSMDRPETIRVIEQWHESLSEHGVFYSIFASTPQKMGEYTDMENSVLPYNRSPRKTSTVDFRGGKYHHTVQSFLAPFWKAGNLRIVKYMFFQNLHFLVTSKAASDG